MRQITCTGGSHGNTELLKEERKEEKQVFIFLVKDNFNQSGIKNDSFARIFSGINLK